MAWLVLDVAPICMCIDTRPADDMTSHFQTLERMSKDFSPEADFVSRGMTKEDFPGRYPYRDFGLKYWEATHTWVKEYLDVSVDLDGGVG